MRRLSAGCILTLALLLGSALLRGLPVYAEGGSGAPLRVVTTLFPLYDWARVIGGDRADVSLLLPPGVEPHSFEPTPRDITAINKADLFIYTGAFMEPWVQDILRGLDHEKKLLAVDTSQGIELMTDVHEQASHGSAGAEGGHQEGSSQSASHESRQEQVHEAGKEHGHGNWDPHIWLDLGNARKMVDTIAGAFARKDPANRQLYLDRAREYNGRLKALDEDFQKSLAGCKSHTIISGGHFAFGYFARRYGLDHVSPYSGVSPDAEPTPKKIAELIETIKKLGATSIFYEENIEPRVARIIREETGARLVLLHGAHNVTRDELAGGATYLSIMEGNLKRLKEGLECP
ncbi:metal ABC transporter solute-binding protein, Zn/Mn family [Desulforhabdus sp. TSK]|uniref:metal ABC transporter solute-binding protein, Zn/Mn family n=1 Tax=Desulforhabdus sp. TSK TaxID=2925014 RepID=UPI001FC897AA|nr:zinc ABC transporter substrate-binding protein [Desulforhabdus sp. TSK]